MKLCMTEPDFFENVCPQNWENGPKMDQKQGFFEFIEKFGHLILLNLFYNENLLFAVSLHKPHICEKSFSWGYGPKCSQPIRLQDSLINHISRANE